MATTQARNPPTIERGLDHRVLIAAPTGSDAEVLSRLLDEGGIEATACADVEELCRQIQRGVAAAIVADEILDTRGRVLLTELLSQQPEWSDLPLIVMVAAGDGPERGWASLNYFKGGADALVLHRPVRTLTLLSSVRTALQARARQYQVRDELAQRRRAEAALRESEEQFRILADSSPVLIWVNGSEGCEFVNRTYREFLGVGDAELRGSKWAQFVHPDDREAYWQAFLQASEQRAVFDAEFRFRRHDGEYRWMRTVGQPRYAADGAFLGYVGSTFDVTAQKRAEQALRRRARQQQAVARLGERALRERDLQQVFDHATASVAETLEVEYAKVLELLPDGKQMLLRAGVGWRPGLVGKVTVGIASNSQAGYSLLCDAPVIVADLRTEQRFNGPSLLTEHGVVSGMSCIIRGRDGKPWGVLGAHTTRSVAFIQDDISYLVAVTNILGEAIRGQLAEQALRESEQRLRLAAEATGFGSYDFDLRRRRMIWSARLYALAGLPDTAEASGELFVSLVHPEDADRFNQHVRQALAPDAPGRHDLEYRIVRPDGQTRWVRDIGRTYFEGEADDRQPVRVIGTVQDITERKRTELELQKLNESLEQQVADRVAAIHTLQDITQTANKATTINQAMTAALQRLSAIGNCQLAHAWQLAEGA